MDEDMKYGQFSKRAFTTLNMLTKTRYRQSSMTNSKYEKPLAEDKDILKRWTKLLSRTLPSSNQSR